MASQLFIDHYNNGDHRESWLRKPPFAAADLGPNCPVGIPQTAPRDANDTRSTVADLAALAALPDGNFSDLDLVYVTSEARVYQLSLLSGAAVSSATRWVDRWMRSNHELAECSRSAPAALVGVPTVRASRGAGAGFLR